MYMTGESPPAGDRGAKTAFDGAENSLTEPAGADLGAPRCVRCGRPLRSTRSAARNYGLRCWTATRTALVQEHRATISRHLDDLAGRLPLLDLDALGRVAEHLADALDTTGGPR